MTATTTASLPLRATFTCATAEELDDIMADLADTEGLDDELLRALGNELTERYGSSTPPLTTMVTITNGGILDALELLVAEIESVTDKMYETDGRLDVKTATITAIAHRLKTIVKAERLGPAT